MFVLTISREVEMKFPAAVLFLVLSMAPVHAASLRSVSKWFKEHKRAVLVSAAAVGAGFAARGVSGSSIPGNTLNIAIPIPRGDSPISRNPIGGRR